MEKTENIATVHASEVPSEEIHDVRTKIYHLVDDHKIAGDSPLVDTIFFILDTLEAGKGVTIFTRLPPEEYVLDGALTRAEAFGIRYGAGPR